MHTPGPWRWFWREDEKNGEADCGVFHEKLPGHAYAVARCPRYQRRERWEADARLIAAAPELLQALRLLHDETADYITINHLGDPHHNQSMKLARATIAKAEGR